MSNSEHLDGARDAHRPFRCTFGPVREKEFVWPPPDEDVDAFTVVRLDGGDAECAASQHAEVAHPAAASKPDQADQPGPHVKPIERIKPLKPVRTIKPTFGDCRAPSQAPRVRPLVVPSVPPPLPPQPLEPASTKSTEPSTKIPADAPTIVLARPLLDGPEDVESTTAGRSAWLAVLFAAACAILAVFEYRIIVQENAEAGLARAEQPPLPQGVSPAELAPSVPQPVKPGTPSPRPTSTTRPPVPKPPATASTAAKVAPSIQPPKAQATRAVTPEPTRRVQPLPSPAARPTPPSPVLVARAEAPAARPVPVAPTPARSAVVPPTAAPAAMSSSASAAGPTLAPPPGPTPGPRPLPTPPAPTAVAERAIDTPSARPSVVLTTAAIDNDEVDIRSTLTRFRTAYSQLDARAARDVWPSVDARALERAFHSLKSQDLRFDRCNLTVTGAKAKASCTGRATYVPRIGDQSPRFTAREWAFELKKADERWTIASARSL